MRQRPLPALVRPPVATEQSSVLLMMASGQQWFTTRIGRSFRCRSRVASCPGSSV